MAIKKLLDCIANHSQKLFLGENRFVHFANEKTDAKTETKTDPEKMNPKEFGELLKTQTGIEIGKNPGQKESDKKPRLVFEVNGVTRSFVLKKDFEGTLKKMFKDGKKPDEIKKAVYDNLLDIVKTKEKNFAKKLRQELSDEITEKQILASNEQMRKFGKEPTPAKENPAEDNATPLVAAENAQKIANTAEEIAKKGTKKILSDRTLEGEFDKKTDKLVKGKITFKTGEGVALGNFDKDENLAEGRLTKENGDVYEGKFNEEYLLSKGTIIFKNDEHISKAEITSRDREKTNTKVFLKDGGIFEGSISKGGIKDGKISYPDGKILVGKWGKGWKSIEQKTSAETAKAPIAPSEKVEKIPEQRKAGGPNAKLETPLLQRETSKEYEEKMRPSPATEHARQVAHEAEKIAENTGKRALKPGEKSVSNLAIKALDGTFTGITDKRNNPIEGSLILSTGDIKKGKFIKNTGAISEGIIIYKENSVKETGKFSDSGNLKEGTHEDEEGIDEGKFKDASESEMTEGTTTFKKTILTQSEEYATKDHSKVKVFLRDSRIFEGTQKETQDGKEWTFTGKLYYKDGKILQGKWDRDYKPIGKLTEIKSAQEKTPSAPATPAPKPSSAPKDNDEKEEKRILGPGETEKTEDGENGEKMEGIFDADNKFIRGKVTLKDGTIFEGTFDPETGFLVKGKINFKSGETQEGDFDKDTSRLAKGKIKFASGEIHEGTFDKKTGKLVQGKMTLVSEETFEGTFDKNTGKPIEGTRTYKKTDEIDTAKGTWDKDGKFSGTFTLKDGRILQGTWDKSGKSIGTPKLIAGGEKQAEPKKPEPKLETKEKTDAEQAKALSDDAKVSVAEGKFKEAAEGFEEAYKLDPKPSYLYNWGRSLQLAGEFQKAKEKYLKVLEIKNLDPNLKDITIKNLAGVEKDIQKNSAGGEKQAPITEHESKPETKEKTDAEKATALSKDAKVYSAEASKASDAGQLDKAREKYGKAAERFEAAYGLNPKPVYLYNCGRALQLMGEFQKAKEKYLQVLKIENLDPVLKTDTHTRLAEVEKDIQKKSAQTAPTEKPTEKKTEQTTEVPKTKSQARFEREEKATLSRKVQYIQTWERMSQEDQDVKDSVSSLGENGIEENWAQIKGHGKVDKILTNREGPFNLNKSDTGKFIAQVITEGSDKTVTLRHIFEFAGKYNKNFPQDYAKFMEKFKELSDKTPDKKAENTEWAKMFNEVVHPALRLLEAIKELEYRGSKEKKESKENLSPEQKLMRTNLYTMFNYSEREPGAWERLMGWFSGAKDEIPVMTDLNGETKYLDRGILKRSYDPKMAYRIFMKTRGAYTIDENNTRTLDPVKTLEETNKLIKLGGTSIAIQKLLLAEKKSLNELQRDPNYRAKLKAEVDKLKLDTLNAPNLITKERMEAFQLGFIISQEIKETKKFEDFKADFEKSPENQKNPIIGGMLKDLEKQGVSKDDVTKIEAKLLAMGAITFKGGKIEAAGLALNTQIAVRPGLTLTVGVVGSKEGITPGAALTLKVYENENLKAGVTAELDLGGIGLGAGVEWKDVNIGIGRAKITVMVGARFGKEIMLGAGVVLTRRNVGLRIEENRSATEKETGLSSKEWDDFKKSKGKPAEERYELLKKVTKLYNTVVVPFEATYEGKDKAETHRDAVYLVDSLKNAIDDKAVDKIASSPWEFFHGAGAIATPYPPFFMPVLVFKLGSAKVFIPHRSEISKLKEVASDRLMQKQLELAVKNANDQMEKGEPISAEQIPQGKEKSAQSKKEAGKEIKTKFGVVDQTGEQSYSPDKRLRTRISGKNAEFTKILAELEEKEPEETKEPPLEPLPKKEKQKLELFNKELVEKVGLKLGEEKDGKHELTVLDDHDEDIAVYIDPNLSPSELGLLVIGGKLHVTGNINNLAVTRERFFMPFKSQKSESNIKDIIVLRTRDSVKGGVTREQIEKYSGAYAEKLEGEGKFYLEKGYGETEQANIKEEKLSPEDEAKLLETSLKKLETEKTKLEGYKSRTVAHTKTKSDIEAHKKGYETRKSQRTERAQEAKEMEKSANRRHKAIGAIDQADYDKQELSEGYYKDLRALASDKKFQEQLGKITDDDEKIKNLIVQHSQDKDKKGNLKYPGLKNIAEKGHEQELDNAVTGVLNTWFLPLYKKGTEGDKTIHEILDRRIKFAKRVLKKSFEKSIQEMNARLPEGQKIKLSAKETANKVIEKMYEKIRDKDFKFSELKWSGEDRATEEIEKDSTLFSATRKRGGKKGEGTLVKTIAYKEQFDSWKKMELDHGFIKTASNEYKLNEGTDEDKQIARLLLEMASPSPEKELKSPEQAEKFLRSPLAVKLATLETLMLIPELGKDKFDKITDLYENIANPAEFKKLFDKMDYLDALDTYKKIVQDIRNAQVEDKPYEAKFTRGGDEYLLRINMSTKVKAGAYARCANASFSVKEQGEVEIFKVQKPTETTPPQYPQVPPEEAQPKPIAIFSESTETVKSEQSKAQLTVALGLGFKPGEEEKTGGKHAEQGASAKPVEGKDAGQGASQPVQGAGGKSYEEIDTGTGSQTGH